MTRFNHFKKTKIMDSQLSRSRIWKGKTVSSLSILFCLLLAVPWSRSAPVVDTVAKLVASDATTNRFFGTSVAIDTGVAAVGAPDLTNGAVYTFAFVGGNWVQTQKLTDPAPPGGTDAFGSSLALQNDVLVVGQPGNPNSFPNSSGQALVYRLVGGTWVLQQILTEINPVFPLGFGTSVAVSGNTIAVGNPSDSNPPGGGSVTIYTNNGTTWNIQAKLTSPATGSLFGQAIALDGNTLLVGDPGIGNIGASYVFVRSGTTWTLTQTLSPTAHLNASFGSSMALEGDTAVIGAPGEPTNGVAGGAAFIFHRTGANFVLQQEVTAPDNAFGFMYANSVAVHNGTIVVGAPRRTINGQTGAGGADIYQFNGISWDLVQQIAAPDASSGSQFGDAVDIGASGIIAGAPFDSAAASGAGAAYIFSSSATNGPVIVSATASPNVLFPPNHKLVPVTITVNATGSFVSCVILGVRSNQPINGKGDGNTSPDWIITGDLTLLLRAERAGNIKTDRVYTITVLCADSFGNTTRTNVTVTVPHDHGK